MRFKSFMQILNEGFGFNYSFPKDKNEAIYDFYALSMIDPQDISVAKYGDVKIASQDEDLRFSLLQAKKTNVQKMKQFMLEALRRAVCAELFHFQPFWDKEKEKIFIEENPDVIDTFKKIRDVVNQYDGTYSRRALTSIYYTERYNRITKLKLPDKTFFNFAALCFDQKKGMWHKTFGGDAWKKIAEGGIKLVVAPDIDPDMDTWRDKGQVGELMIAIDHAIDLAHNTGTVFSKWDDSGLSSPDAVSMTTLETKKHIIQLNEYIPLVSYQLKAPIRHITRHEKPVSEFVKKNINLYSTGITKLPDNLPEKLDGNFHCNSNDKLRNLKGSPVEVTGDFTCGNNKLLTSLEGAPVSVGKDFFCNNCNLKSLIGMPKNIGGNVDCSGNPVQFKEEDIRKISKVNGQVFT